MQVSRQHRLYVSAFLLRQLADRRGLEHTRALQALLASAQAAGDEKLLRNAFLQLDGMLRLELVQLGGGG